MEDPLPDSLLSKLRDLRSRYATPRVRPTAVKLFADGVIESRTAALLQPYLDRKGDSGQPIYDPVRLKELATGRGAGMSPDEGGQGFIGHDQPPCCSRSRCTDVMFRNVAGMPRHRSSRLPENVESP